MFDVLPERNDIECCRRSHELIGAGDDRAVHQIGGKGRHGAGELNTSGLPAPALCNMQKKPCRTANVQQLAALLRELLNNAQAAASITLVRWALGKIVLIAEGAPDIVAFLLVERRQGIRIRWRADEQKPAQETLHNAIALDRQIVASADRLAERAAY